MRRLRRRMAGVSLLLLMASVVFGLGIFLSALGLDRADKFGSAASLVIAVVALLQPAVSHVSRWFRSSPPASVIAMAQAQSELATALARRLAEDDAWRRIHDPWPLPVRYRSEQSGTTGSYSDFVGVFRSLQQRRLVILGPAGAGKSVLVARLARDLLATHRADEPVPVILSAATWRPEINVSAWIEAELELSYPALSGPVVAADGTTTYARMLADGGVLPIVDALDELPEPLRVRAIANLSAYGSDRPIVITSRPNEYEQAIATFGRPLARVETLTLTPLRLEESRRYLLEATAGSSRWDGVFEELDRDPTGPLARTLTNPLLLGLARTIYEHPDTDPGELLARGHTEDEIQSHLLGGFVPAVYQDRPGHRSRWRLERAERWLSFLAKRVYSYEHGDVGQMVAWWRLPLVMSQGSLFGRRFVKAVALATTLLWLAQSYRRDADGFASAARSAADDGLLGRAMLPGLEQLVVDIESQFPGTGEVMLQVLPRPGLSYVIWILVLTAAQWGAEYPEKFSEPSVLAVRLWPLVARSVAGGTLTMLLLLVGALPVLDPSVSVGTVLALPAGGVSLWVLARYARECLTTQASVDDARNPRQSLRVDRTASLIVACVQAVAVSGIVALLVGVSVGLALLAVTIMVAMLRHLIGSNRKRRFASEAYARARLEGWLHRRLPWRLMTFLADSRRRGVLRQSGSVYRFRHVRMLEHLARREDQSLARHDRLAVQLERLEGRMHGVADRVMESAEHRRSSHAEHGLQVTGAGLTRSYRDPRLDRWPGIRGRTVDRPALPELDVVVDPTGAVIGRRPRTGHLLLAAAILPFGSHRARQYLARHAGPLLPSDVVRELGDRGRLTTELTWSGLTLPTSLRPGEVLHLDFRQHPFALASVAVVASITLLAGVVLALLGANGINLFELAGFFVCLSAGSYVTWRLCDYLRNQFLLTDQRLVWVGGLITRVVAELPLTAIGDLACTRGLAGAIWDFGRIDITIDPDVVYVGYLTSPLGRRLGYGSVALVDRSSGLLTTMAFVPDLLETYRLMIDAVEASRAEQLITDG